MMEIQREVHSMPPERSEVFAAKLRLFPEGCRMLMREGQPVGYAIAHPWPLDDVPPLDEVFGALPTAPDCLFLHDVALRPPARRQGAGHAYAAEMAAIASGRGLAALALVSVYDSFPIWEACGFRFRTSPQLVAKLGPYGEMARYMAMTVR